MEYLSAVFLGLSAAAGATLFPGMLNMTSVNVSLRAGRKAGYSFSLGMALAVTAQAGVAVFFARYLTTNAGILHSMKQWAALVFLLLAVFFLVKGYRAQVAELSAFDRPYRGSPLLRGGLLALMNLLTVPYFFAISGWFLSYGYLNATPLSRTLFTLSAGIGALTIFMTYARLAEWMYRNARFFTRHINYFLGGLLLVLAFVQGLNVYL